MCVSHGVCNTQIFEISAGTDGTLKFLGGAYEEKLAWTKSLQSGKTSILPVRQGVPGFIRDLQRSDIGDIFIPRHVPIELNIISHVLTSDINAG